MKILSSRSIYMESLTWVLSFCSDLDLEPMVLMRNWVDIILETVVKLAIFLSVSASIGGCRAGTDGQERAMPNQKFSDGESRHFVIKQ